MNIQFFDIKKNTASTRWILFYFFTAYMIGIFVRLFMLQYIYSDEQMWLQSGTPVPILTPDASLYGYYAQEILKGHRYGLDEVDKLPGYLLAAVSYLLHINLDRLLFWLPVILAPLVTLPLLLIGKMQKQLLLGFVAALFCVTDSTFSIRSHVGYYDTDILNLFFPLMIIWTMMLVDKSQKLLYAFWGALFILGFRLWYHSYGSIALALIIFFLFYTLLFGRNKKVNYSAFVLFIIVLLPLHPLWVLGLIGLAYFILARFSEKVKFDKRIIWIFIFLMFTVLILTDMSHIYNRVMDYFDMPVMQLLHTPQGDYQFLNTLQTVAETLKVGIVESRGRFDEKSSLVLLGSLGYFLMIIRYRSMLLLFPLLLLGYTSGILGARFMMYAVPPLAFGLAYLLLWVFDVLMRHRTSRILYFARGITIGLVILFMANTVREESQYYRPVFAAQEVSAIRDFSKRLSPADTIVTWWDYGWPLWYYTGYANTVADNGEHGSYDTYLISKLLLHNSDRFVANAATCLSSLRKKASEKGFKTVLSYLAQEYELTSEIKRWEHELPEYCYGQEKGGEVYIALYSSMFNYIGTVLRASNYDIRSGKFYKGKLVQYDILPNGYENNESVIKGELLSFVPMNGTILTNQGKYMPISRFFITKKHKTEMERDYNDSAHISLAIVKNKYAVYMDNTLFDSFLVRAYLLDQYDHSLFEKVAETPLMKILRVKNNTEK